MPTSTDASSGGGDDDGDDTGSSSDDTGTGSDDTGTGSDDTGTGSDDTGTGSDDTGTGSDDTGGGLKGTGFEVGHIAYDLQATDHSGSPWSLHDRLGTKVVLLAGHMYSSSMEQMMEYLGEVDDDFSGLVVVALVGYDEYNNVATEDDASRLASEYGVSTVLYDGSLKLIPLWASGNPPKTYVIDQSMTISYAEHGGVSEDDLRDAVENLGQ